MDCRKTMQGKDVGTEPIRPSGDLNPVGALRSVNNAPGSEVNEVEGSDVCTFDEVCLAYVQTGAGRRETPRQNVSCSVTAPTAGLINALGSDDLFAHRP